MTRPTAYQKRQAKARQRRRLTAHERRERDQRQAQRAADALPHALEALGLPADLVGASEGRLHRQHQLLGTMVGGMVPALLGWRTPAALGRVRGWDTHWPSRRLGALPQRSGRTPRRRWGREGLEPLWRPGQAKSPATQSRWPWPGVWADAVFHNSGAPVGLVGRRWSGQHKRVWPGRDGLVLRVVVGAGRVLVPVDGARRRPAPWGPGAPCRDKLRWARVRLAERLAAWGRRGLELPAPVGVAGPVVWRLEAHAAWA